MLWILEPVRRLLEVLGQACILASRSLVDLPLSETFRPSEVRLAQVRLEQVRQAEVRPGEVCSAEVRSVEVRPAKVRPAQVGQAQIRFAEVRLREIRTYFRILLPPPIPDLDTLLEEVEMFWVGHGVKVLSEIKSRCSRQCTSV